MRKCCGNCVYYDRECKLVGVDYDETWPELEEGCKCFKPKCSGDCDNCKYAYNETDHGYAYEESKLHCRLEESKMNKELIKQQLNAFYGVLRTSRDLELHATERSSSNTDFYETYRHVTAAYAYQEMIDLFYKVQEHIEKLMEDTNNE